MSNDQLGDHNLTTIVYVIDLKTLGRKRKKNEKDKTPFNFIVFITFDLFISEV